MKRLKGFTPFSGLFGPSFVIALVSFALFIMSSAPCEAVTAGAVVVKGLYSIGQAEFLEMLGIRQGGQVDAEAVKEGIKRAFLKGIFDDIQVRVPDGANPIVEVTVKERDFISKVRVTGESSLSSKVLRGLFMLKEDDLMRYDLIPQAVKDLKDRVAKYGFPEAEIAVGTEKTGKPHRVDLVLSVNTGQPLTIRKIKINVLSPHPLLEAGRSSIYSAMKLTIGDTYNQMKVEEDLKRIKAFLVKEGFYGASVGPYSYREGELEISADPGKHLAVSITGNKAISTKTLMKEVPFFEIGEYNDEVLGEAIDKMLSLYHAEGYPFAQIAPVISSDARNIDVSLFVYEGEMVKVGTITFSGATLPQKTLQSVMSLKQGGPYNPDAVDRDRDSLKELYAALGYLEADIADIGVKVDKASRTAAIAVEIREGEKTVISSVGITGVKEAMKDKLMAIVKIKAGDPYNDVDISDARFRMIEYLATSGYAAADVTVSRKLENHLASVTFGVVEEAKLFFGRTVIVGNRRTKYQVIWRELPYKEGDPYSARKITEVRQRLFKLGLFTSVGVETVDGEGGRKDVIIKVAEAEAGTIEFGVGYADVENFRGFVQVGYNNLWGLDKQVMLRTEYSSLERRVILQYREPRFVGINLPFRTFFLYENKKELNPDNDQILYKLNRYTVTSGFEKQLNKRLKGELYYEFDVVNTRDVLPDVILTREDTGTLAISSIKPALIYDSRDNPFDPTKGIFAGISLKVASFILFSQTNFVKLESYASNFQKLSNRIVLALSARGGVAYGYDKTNELPIVERFFLGGRSTVRGYAQDTLGPKGPDGNPTGGNAYLMGNVEFRISVGRGFGIVPFLDMGNVWINTNDMNPAQLKYTTGLGLRYGTPVGPLRVDYGYKLNREIGETHGEIHFSIGQAF